MQTTNPPTRTTGTLSHGKRPIQSRLSRAALVMGATLAAAFATQAAPVTYTYTAPITSWINSYGIGAWGLYGGLDGSAMKFDFTVAAPLRNIGCGVGPLSVGCDANVQPEVLSWHYHGGSAFMNTGSDLGGHLTGLVMSTDASGQVTQARFYLDGPVVIPTLEAETSFITEAHDGYDQQQLFSSFLRQYTRGMLGEPLYASLGEGFSNMRGAGSWSMTNALAVDPGNGVPEPKSLLLMLSALGLLTATTLRQKPPAGCLHFSGTPA